MIKDPENEKFRRVNLDNDAVQKRVGKVNGGLAILRGVGFENAPDGNFLVLEKVDMDVLKKTEELLKPLFE